MSSPGQSGSAGIAGGDIPADRLRSKSHNCTSGAASQALAFEVWMRHVAFLMEVGYSFHPDDIADCPYADWHGSGVSPAEAVEEAILYAFGEER